VTLRWPEQEHGAEFGCTGGGSRLVAPDQAPGIVALVLLSGATEPLSNLLYLPEPAPWR